MGIHGQVKIERYVGILAILNIAMIALISGKPYFTNASHAFRGITSPFFAIEVARNPEEVDLVLSDAPSADREAMRIKRYADFGFIAAYAALYIALARMFGGRFALAGAGLGVIAAIFNVIENLAILKILDVDLAHTTQGLIDAIRYPGLIEWACTSVALGIFAVLMIRTKRTLLRIAGLFELAAALLGASGLAKNFILQWMPIPLLCGLVGLAVLLFRPHRNRVGYP